MRALIFFCFCFLYRLCCDLIQMPEIPFTLQVRNTLSTPAEMCWVGTPTDVTLDLKHCFTFSAGEEREFGAHLYHMHVLRSTESKVWHIMAVLPGQGKYDITEDLGLFGKTDAEFWVRFWLRMGRHSLPIRWTGDHHWEMRLVIFLLAVVVNRFVSEVDLSSEHEASKKREKLDGSRGGNQHNGGDAVVQAAVRIAREKNWGLLAREWLKFIAIFFMIVDHYGRVIIMKDLWWKVGSRALSMPIFFFLNGYGAAFSSSGSSSKGGKHNSMDKLLFAFFFLCFVMGMEQMASGTVLLSHAVAHLLLTRLNIARWHNDAHFWFLGVLLMTQVLANDGFRLDAGTAPLILAVAGYLHGIAQHYPSLKKGNTIWAFVYLTVGNVLHCENSYVAEFRSRGPFVMYSYQVIIATLLFLPQTIVLMGLKPNSRWNTIVPAKFTAVMTPVVKFSCRYALEIYVVHTLLLDLHFFRMNRGGIVGAIYKWF